MQKIHAMMHDVWTLLCCFLLLPRSKPLQLPVPVTSRQWTLSAQSTANSASLQEQENVHNNSSRRGTVMILSSLLLGLFVPATTRTNAAPPIAIIAEELGYFPVTNRQGDTVYLPKSVQRTSSNQAISLAKRLNQEGVVMAGAYWCSHTSRQKELFGKEAWKEIRYTECARNGFGADPNYCATQKVEGYPTWIFPDGRQVSGERPLAMLAEEVGFKGFDANRESKLPSLSGSACS